MTLHRRMLCFLMALSLMLLLVPAVTGSDTAAYADSARKGITTADKVNLRYGAGSSNKIVFKLPKDHICTILDTKVVEKVTWYRVETNDPERQNGNTYYGWIHGDFFRELTEEEIAQYAASGTVATPTPVPEAGDGTAPTPTPTPAATNQDLPAVAGSIGSVTAGGTNLREGPGTGYKSMMRLDRNTQVELITIPSIRGAGANTFFKVRYNGNVGYIMSEFVSIISGGPENGTSIIVTPTPKAGTATPTPTPVAGNVKGYVRTKVGGCNLRASIPNGTVIKQIKKNVTLPYILDPIQKNGYTWYYVVDGNNRGYLRGDIVKVVSDPGATPTPTPTPTPAPGQPTATPTATPTPVPNATGYVRTTSGGVNLRKKAGFKGDLIGRVDRNVLMPYFGEPTVISNVKWYYVEHPTLGKGYMHGDFLELCNADGSSVVLPTASPTPTPEPGTTPDPSSGKQEASYTTLKVGSSGTAVKNLVNELKSQGYYTGSTTSSYTKDVESAVKAFQKAKGLTVDGVAGSATQHALYNTVPVGAGDTSNLTMTLYPAEKIDWNTGGINELWARGSNYKVYDVKTGIVWWAHRWAGGLHVDAEPLTAADTARLCKCYGVTTAQEIEDKDLWQRRPLLVTIGTRTFACSLYGVPHNYPDGDTISTNEFRGQVCIHFTNSKTHDSRKVDSNHEKAIQYAYDNCPAGHK